MNIIKKLTIVALSIVILMPGLYADAAKTVAKKDATKTNIDVNSLMSNSSLKISWADTNDVMQNSSAGEQATQRTDTKREELSKNVQDIAQQIQKEVQNYESKKNMLSEQARKDQEAKLTKMDREYKNAVQGAEEEFKMFVMQETEQLSKMMVDAAKDFAEKQKVDVVIDAVSGRPIYVSPKADCTLGLRKSLDKKHEEKLAAAKKQEKTATA